MLFYKNFIGVYDNDGEGGLKGFITEIGRVIEFRGKDTEDIMNSFCVEVDIYIESQRIVEKEQ